MVEYRDYQQTCIDETVKFLLADTDPFRLLWSGPTGSGKSFIELAVLYRVPDCWLITPKIEIIAGMLEKLGRTVDGFSEDGIVEMGMRHRMGTPIRMSHRWMDGSLLTPKRIILDEAHHDNADTYQNIYHMTLARMVGFTATPFRGTPKETALLWERWGEPRTIITYDGAAKRGDISLPYCATIPLIDDDIVKVENSEFQIKSLTDVTMSKLADAANLVSKFYDPVEQRYSRSTLIVVPSWEVGNELQYLIPNGRFISADTTKKRRLELIAQCERGLIGLIHINTITEGVDAKIRRCIDLSPTMSPVKWAQGHIGRITRPVGDNESAPEYYCCNRNLLRHSYILGGALPMVRESILQAEAAFKGYGKRPSGGRIFGTEGLGKLQGTEVAMTNGLKALFYCFSVTEDKTVINYAVIFHPLQQKPLWACRHDKVGESTRTVEVSGRFIQVPKKDYGTWELCEPLREGIIGFASAHTGALKEKQKSWWDRQAERVGIAEKNPTNKQFQILPVLNDTGVYLE